MRTKALLSVAAALAAGAFTAQAQVYSVNIVGYVNQPLAGSGGFTAAANPLDDGSNTLDSALSNLPLDSTVQFWNGAGFDVVSRVPDFLGGWSGLNGGATDVSPGKGFFISVPSAAMTNTWVGEVLTGDLTNSLGAGFNFVGNQAPIAGTPADIGLEPAMQLDDTIQKWNGSGYTVYSKVPDFLGTWSPDVPTLDVGEGFFVNVASPADWTQSVNP